MGRKILKIVPIRINLGPSGTRQYHANYMALYRAAQRDASIENIMRAARKRGLIKP